MTIGSNRAAAALIPVLAFAILVGGTSASSAQGRPDTLTVERCTTAWNSAAASPYCTNPTIAVSNNECDLDGSCSIAVTVTDAAGNAAATTFTPSLDLTLQRSKVDGIDICFAENSAGTAFEAAVKSECGSGETGSKSAANGLSLGGG